ncbi:MAG TPA: hypothetical protein PL017_06310 [Tenuifilaceae bacterium]|nr:hypothetical protein [Tenuifilaceae bacterium]HPE18713.1 hypothetical protein [Tenuifilaceae bacterium]HPJ45694.1 hypothetical protein [Tenuifilaceae bacterium]HPQ34942.1 hypothetical protein [Tenuifilaceae bacterium]HRX68279.1 hypothetical protein [Tenuifilaceae bacterium]
MIFLALSILSSALILVVFKLLSRYKVHTFSAIIVNYLTACLAGFFLSSSNPFTASVFTQKWFPIALLIGVMFIVMFYVIGKSTQKAGVAVTTVAVKMSVVAPIAFSIYYDANDSLTLLKTIGILLAVLSVLLTVYQKNNKQIDIKKILLPAFLFIGMGIVDSFVKFAQATYITNELTPTFSSLTFTVSLVIGILILPFNHNAAKNLSKIKSWILGVLLGLFNFGSMYFLILALNHVDVSTGEQAMGSVVFGINNIGIVTLSVLIGFTFFKERPKALNWVGIALSGVAIIILAIS